MTYSDLSILVDVSFIEETVAEEFAALRKIFTDCKADYESDYIWADVNGVGLYGLDEFISVVGDPAFHTQDTMDDFHSQVTNAIKAIETAFYEKTGIEITSIMTYEDYSYETINDNPEIEILPVYGPNFAIPDLTVSELPNLLKHPDKIGFL